MKPPVDLLGNPLVEGQFCGLKLGDQVLFGKIVKLNEGGLDLPNSKGKTSGSMLFLVQVPILFMPGARIENMFRVVGPTSTSILEKLSDGTKPDKTAN